MKNFSLDLLSSYKMKKPRDRSRNLRKDLKKRRVKLGNSADFSGKTERAWFFLLQVRDNKR